MFLIDELMIKEIIKIDIELIEEIGEFYLVLEYNVDTIIQIDQGMSRTIEITLEEVNSGKCKTESDV